MQTVLCMQIHKELKQSNLSEIPVENVGDQSNEAGLQTGPYYYNLSWRFVCKTVKALKMFRLERIIQANTDSHYISIALGKKANLVPLNKELLKH